MSLEQNPGCWPKFLRFLAPGENPAPDHIWYHTWPQFDTAHTTIHPESYYSLVGPYTVLITKTGMCIKTVEGMDDQTAYEKARLLLKRDGPRYLHILGGR